MAALCQALGRYFALAAGTLQVQSPAGAPVVFLSNMWLLVLWLLLLLVLRLLALLSFHILVSSFSILGNFAAERGGLKSRDIFSLAADFMMT